jgi:predicted DNA-binding transcriptional regulator AlpA
MHNKNSLVLSAPEAAGRLNLSTSTLAKLRLAGSGPAFSKLGRRVVYMEQDLLDWISDRRFRSTAEYPIAVKRVGP